MRAAPVSGPAGLLVVGATAWLALLITLGASAAPAGTSSSATAAATLALRGELRLVSSLGTCPQGVSATACAARTGAGVVRGLGRVIESYTWLADLGAPSCPDGSGRALGTSVRFAVGGKGEIDLRIAEARECVAQEAVRTQAQSFTVAGGTGIYAGATGSGTVERTLGGDTASGRVGRETWTGTLEVPGLEFDVTPPTLIGAKNKVVRAPRTARRIPVTFTVRARDDVDGAVPVTCKPRSGSRFRVGRTPVTCTATDMSGNTARTRFTVTVARGR